ncbi:MAG: MerR family transcriptional regulator [Lachnospiraceae bacterium]|nr:MerR family transcriptional regulator [Lachnospiraceae bacterium]
MARYLISEAARLTDVEAHVLRYWEEELELEIPRNELGHRYYTEEHIAIFKHIKDMKAQGFQLRAIRESLARVDAVKRVVRETEARLAAVRELEAAQEVAASEFELPKEDEAVLEETCQEQEKSDPEELKIVGLENESEEEIEEAAEPAAGLSVSPQANKLVEFESIVYDIVTQALRNNNERLGREVSERVNDKVVKEMNYLMRENEEHMEEHFRKLDEALVRKGRRFKLGGQKEAAVTRITNSPAIVSTKRKRRLFGRKRKTTIY